MLLFCGAMVFFTLLDSAAKYATAYLPTLEIAGFRFVVHAAFAVLIFRPWRDWSFYWTRRPGAQIMRALMLAGSTAFNFLALRTLRLDQTTTVLFASALVTAALSGPILGEWVGPRRWAAIIVGFIGVLIVIRPGTSGFEPAILFSVASMCCYVAYLLLTRHLTTTDSPESMLLISAVIPALLFVPAALPSAVMPPTLLVTGALLVTGICGALGHWMLIHAHRLAPTSSLAPFIYTQLVWMTVAGYVFFRQLPDRYTLVGATLIVGSALYILYRQRVHGDQ
ncbi:DMT family transporter [Bauldia sp.]|uniref:DMT family transporter n=1 Tax=Bauldia sp. TaxID=2575872 RepID=UPI0025C685A7|nr:DMT family transporter [Bauldia sp.]